MQLIVEVPLSVGLKHRGSAMLSRRIWARNAGDNINRQAKRLHVIQHATFGWVVKCGIKGVSQTEEQKTRQGKGRTMQWTLQVMQLMILSFKAPGEQRGLRGKIRVRCYSYHSCFKYRPIKKTY